MKRSILSLIVVALLAGTAAADRDVTFETVDEVGRGINPFNDDELRVRGIPQGQTEEVLVSVAVGFNAEDYRERVAGCERMALMAASRPGRYLLRIATGGSGDTFLVSCSLIRR